MTEAITRLCAAYPERCEAPSDLETVVLQTHAKQSRLMYEDQVAAIDANEEWDRGKWDRAINAATDAAVARVRKELEDPRRECVIEERGSGWVQTCRDGQVNREAKGRGEGE